MRILLIMSFLFSTKAFSWYSILPNQCEYTAVLSPTVAYDFAVSERGGFSNCKTVTPEAGVKIVMCLEPYSGMTWSFANSFALCNKYKEELVYISTMDKYFSCDTSKRKCWYK